MAQRVRPVNCGTNVADGEFAGGAPKDDDYDDDGYDDNYGDEGRGCWRRAKVLTLSEHDFFAAERYSFLVPIPGLLDFFVTRGLKDVGVARPFSTLRAAFHRFPSASRLGNFNFDGRKAREIGARPGTDRGPQSALCLGRISLRAFKINPTHRHRLRGCQL
ncbi:hypothetical protein KM043_005358 [Ampulex compressa]|nr:hypothetical protein KM043_005358 [Ampulex compressa]